jgi:kynureninase
MESPAFPSDTYAVHTHLQARGLDPVENVLTVGPRAGEQTVRTEDLEAMIERHGDEIALVLIGGVNFLTGQAFDLARITAAAHARGCLAGFDLAHAAGNVELRLHDWDVDFAAWCSYKYLNGGPGAIAGCFIHERHARDIARPRFGGWWGNDPETRFRMQLESTFIPKADADGWQLSNPPILAMAPLRASLEIFDEVGLSALREKSLRLTGYLRALLVAAPARDFEIITPRADDAHGCQLSIEVRERPRERFEALQAAGVVCDFRPPDVIRAAPVPLYNTYHDAWRFARILAGSRDD